VYTTLGQTLRVPLTAAPERQLVGWLHRQQAANPGFPVRVRSILLVLPQPPRPTAHQALLQQLGRWQLTRRLRVVSAAPRARGGSQELETPLTVMHPDIDVHAQRALLRMSRSPDPWLRRAATGLLAAVHTGALRGIFLEDQRIPALRAQAKGIGWWQIIPPDSDAVRLPDPKGQEPPLIAFRNAIRSNSARLDEALLTAWMAPLAPPPRGYYGRPA
jgi:hypothetical protein